MTTLIKQRTFHYPLTGGYIDADLIVTSSRVGNIQLKRQMDVAFGMLTACYAGVGSDLGVQFSPTAPNRAHKYSSSVDLDDLIIVVSIAAMAQPRNMCDGEFVDTIHKGLDDLWHSIVDAFNEPVRPPRSRGLFDDIGPLLRRSPLTGLHGIRLGDMGDFESIWATQER